MGSRAERSHLVGVMPILSANWQRQPDPNHPVSIWLGKNGDVLADEESEVFEIGARDVNHAGLVAIHAPQRNPASHRATP